MRRRALACRSARLASPGRAGRRAAWRLRSRGSAGARVSARSTPAPFARRRRAGAPSAATSPRCRSAPTARSWSSSRPPAGRLLVRGAASRCPTSRSAPRCAASGALADPEPWRAAWLRRRGIAMVARGRADRADRRASAAASPGGSTRSASAPRPPWGGACRTARRRSPAASCSARTIAIDPATVDDFKRSGLAHLLAVSGQNVVLLCLLAWPFLALAGSPCGRGWWPCWR